MFYCSPCSLNRQPSWSQFPCIKLICIHQLIVNSSFLFFRSDPLPGWEISFLFFLQSPDGKYLSFYPIPGWEISFLSPIPGWEISFFSLSNPRMGNIVLFFIFSLSTSLLSLLQREILDAAVVVSAVGLGLISRFK